MPTDPRLAPLGGDPMRGVYQELRDAKARLSALERQGQKGATGPAGPAMAVQDEGISVPSRSTMNFVGTGVTATDDAANTRTLVTIPGGSSGGIVVHDDIQFFSGSIAASGTADINFDYASPAVVALLTRIRTDRAARVRVYTDTTHRTADRSRSVSTDPVGDHGCLLEVVTIVGVLDLKLSPGVIARAPTGTTLPVIVDNLDNSNALTGVWMTWFGGT